MLLHSKHHACACLIHLKKTASLPKIVQNLSDGEKNTVQNIEVKTCNNPAGTPFLLLNTKINFI